MMRADPKFCARYLHHVRTGEVIALWMAGHTLAEIARYFKCSTATIDRRLAFGGAYRRQHERQIMPRRRRT